MKRAIYTHDKAHPEIVASLSVAFVYVQGPRKTRRSDSILRRKFRYAISYSWS